MMSNDLIKGYLFVIALCCLGTHMGILLVKPDVYRRFAKTLPYPAYGWDRPDYVFRIIGFMGWAIMAPVIYGVWCFLIQKDLLGAVLILMAMTLTMVIGGFLLAFPARIAGIIKLRLDTAASGSGPPFIVRVRIVGFALLCNSLVGIYWVISRVH